MRNLVLIGMPGSGKSTVGVLLAKSLGFDFLDTDLLLQRRTGKSLQALLDEDGCSAFLAAEDALLRSLDVSQTVIATGGSAVYSPDGMAHLAGQGLIVWLRIDYPTLCRRLGDYSARGIVGAGERPLEAIFAEREALCARYAALTVNCIDGTDGVEYTRQRVLEILSAHRLMLESE